MDFLCFVNRYFDPFMHKNKNVSQMIDKYKKPCYNNSYEIHMFYGKAYCFHVTMRQI